MPSIGPITIPSAVAVAAFPLIAAYNSTQVFTPQVVVHRMGAANGKRVQIMKGPNLRRFVAQFAPIGKPAHDALLAWFETTKGQLAYFDFTFRANDGSTTVPVRLAEGALSVEILKGWKSRPQSITFLEVPSSTPTYTVATTLDRFPNSTLSAALLDQVQEIIPLVRIRVTDPAVDDIFVSDRLCIVGGTRYEPRILDWGGIGQQTGERADQASFTLGNADDVFTQLLESVDLSYAEVQVSLYHVQSQIKDDLWKGFLAADGAWSMNDDSATVELRVTDGLASSTNAFPVRAIEPRCWKELDGPHCPVSSVGANAGTSCDKGWDTPAGCLFHSMGAYFGGVVTKPQLVQLKTDTSFFGPRASILSASSVINEGAFGRPLKEVYTDVDLPVPCDVLAGRDESEFRAGLGIIGQGPIGAFGADLTRQTLDNVGPHGGNTGLGFRGIRGTDPVTDTTKERLGIDEARYGWNPPPDSPLAAGVAAIQVRRTDQKGIQGFRPADWAMSSLVSLGLGGWKWTASGSRVWANGLTNNVWIAANMWLKANGVWCDAAHASAVDVSTMERFIDVDACIAAAAVCDASVPTLVGTGNETQFKFCGIVGEFRQVRQWIQNVLDSALCDYSFRNGKLRIYARVNASAASAFGPGNVIFRSLRTEMRVPRFNYLTVEFGDQEYDFGRNGVVLYDEDHGKRKAAAGGQPVYVKTTMSPAGVTRKSHGARLNITLLREELGGYTAADQKKARNVSWKTTILALDVEPGMVVSLNGFAKIPDGTKVRVNGWTLNSDWSITLTGSTVVSSMYDYAVGPKPADVEYGPPGIERAPAIRDRRWFPNFIAPDADDPTLDENDLSFAAGISYDSYSDGSKRALLTIQGKPHVNTTLAADLPQLRTIAFAGTGGALIGTKPLYLCVAPFDSVGRMGPRSRMIMTYLDAATPTCTATVSNVTWPSGTWAGYKVYAANEERAVCLQATVTGSLPSSFTFAGPLKRSTEGPPETGDKGYHLRAKELLVPGAMKSIVTSLPTTTKVICSALAGTSADYAGETLMVIGDASEGFAPLRTWTITGWNATTGEFTLDRTHAGADPLQPGDTVLVLARVTSSSSTTVACSKLAMADDEFAGCIVRLVYGQGAGQFRRISANSATTITVDSEWDAAPSVGAFFVVERANWQYEAPIPAPNTENSDQSVILQVPVENLTGRTLLAMGFLVDGAGNTGSEDIAPFRLVEVVGSEGVAPGNDPPSAIRTPSIVDIDVLSDPGYLLVKIAALAPETLNNFDHVTGWLVVDDNEPIGVGQISHPQGSAADVSGVFRIGRPTATAWTGAKLFLASGSATYENSLVTAEGSGQTPFVTIGTIEPYTPGAPAAPTAPTAVAVTVVEDGDTFSLLTQWTPADPIGGTTQWGRQVRFYNDAGCTVPDTDDWIDIGPIYGAATIENQTAFWPKRTFPQWVKLQVRGMNWQNGVSDWVESTTGQLIEAATSSAAEAPEVPLGCSVTVLPKEGTFGLQIGITPPSPLGGTAGYDREAKYYNDAGCTVEDHPDWINLGWVDKDSTTSTTAFWPRPAYNQWVKVRVRGTNWDGVVTEWVVSGSAAALTPIAAPPAVAAINTTVRTRNSNGIPSFAFSIAITPNATPASTDWYEIQVRYWNDSGLTTPDSDWIPLGGTSPSLLTLDTDFWPRPKATQYAKTRVAAKNANGELGSWVESSVLTIPASTGLNAGELDINSLTLTRFVISGGKLDIAALGIGVSQLADSAVTNAKLAAASVASGNIIDGTIVNGDIAAATILGSNIGFGVISSTNIGTGAIIGTNIATAAILSVHIQDGTIVSNDIANATIAGTNIQSATIAAGNIVNATLTATQIANSTITSVQIASNTVTSANIQDGSIVAADMANLTITAAKIQGLTITAAEIANLTINGTKITDSTLTDGKVASGTLGGDKLQNATVTGTKIATATVTSTNIANATIATSNLGSGVITATNIASLTITAAQIADLTITSSKIASISADKITAGTISASISMTAPTISVSGSGFTANIDATNGIRLVNTFNSSTVSMKNGWIQTTAGSYTGNFTTAWVSINGNTGNVTLGADTSVGGSQLLVGNTSSQGFYVTPTQLGCQVAGGSIQMNGSSQYISAAQYRLASNFASSGGSLGGYTLSYVWYLYNSSGSYLGFVPILN